MIRAGAKNHEFVTVITDTSDYPELIKQIQQNNSTTYSFRKLLAAKAFKLTSEYDMAIAQWFNKDTILHVIFLIRLMCNISKLKKCATVKTLIKRRLFTPKLTPPKPVWPPQNSYKVKSFHSTILLILMRHLNASNSLITRPALLLNTPTPVAFQLRLI